MMSQYSWRMTNHTEKSAGNHLKASSSASMSLQGVTFPAMMAMWARWAPPLERSRLMSMSGSGANFGAFLALPLTGLICQTLGWPAVFYLCGEGEKQIAQTQMRSHGHMHHNVHSDGQIHSLPLSGSVGCLWAVFWFIFVSDDPRTHRRISKEERDYIINSIGSQVHMKQQTFSLLGCSLSFSSHVKQGSC